MTSAEVLRPIVGSDAVAAGDAARPFAIDGQAPPCVVFPPTIDVLSRCVAAAHAAGLSIVPAGNGTRLCSGRAPATYDVAVSTQRLSRIVAHEAADMTVSVEAGLTLAALNAALGRAGQWLPLDPPQPERTTIGALIATDASGPHRLAHGKVRDLLIGVTVVLADGTLVKGGGRVVKNVAGYDLMKLFTGSFGTLGIIAEATFKVRPRSEHTSVFVVPVDGIGVAVALAQAVLDAPLGEPLAPAYVEVLNPRAGHAVGLAGAAVVVGCGGLAPELEVQRERLEARARLLVAGGSVPACNAEEGTRLYTALRDLPADAGFTAIATISVLPSRLGKVLMEVEHAAAGEHLGVAILSHAGHGIAILGVNGTAGGAALVRVADQLIALVRGAAGWLRFDRVPAELRDRIDAWPMQPPGLELMRGIKGALDPQGRLSSGRFVGGI